jgi:uncharacterized protein YecT (DUF1311 family)
MACWLEYLVGAREDLEDVVSGARKRKPMNARTASLLADETAWAAKRDAKCEATNDYPGGSAGELTVGKCLYQANRKRLAEYEAAGNPLPTDNVVDGSTTGQ